MGIVVDTNIAFSIILNTNSRLAQIFLMPKTRLNFYSTKQLLNEINEHKDKLKKLANYSEYELSRLIYLVTNRIKFIDVQLIPDEVYSMSEN